MNFINLKNQQNIIKDVIIRPLIIHKDDSGSLVETLRIDWSDVFSQDKQFKMQYISKTPSGKIRDEHEWHMHKNQKDRFICISGKIVTAIYDPRDDSPTKGTLNLFVMGPENDNEMYMLVIPENTYHGFMVVSDSDGVLANFPTQLYNPEDEGRVKNSQFKWSNIKKGYLK